MAEQLLIRCLPGSDQVQWGLLGDDGRMHSRDSGTLADVSTFAEGRSISVILPASEALLMPALVPGGSRSRVIAAVPYVLEDNLLEDVDQYHFVVGKTQGQDIYPVVVVAKQALQQRLASFTEAGMQPQRMYTEASLLPFEDQAWTLVFEGQQLLVREDQSRSYGMEQEDLALLLSSREAQEQPPKKLVVYGEPPAEFSAPENTELTEYAGIGVWELYAQGLSNAQNLLQGEYARSTQVNKALLPWRVSLGMAAAIVLLLLVSVSAEYFSLNSQLHAVQTDIETVLRQTFPDIKRIPPGSERNLMKQRLGKLRGQGGQGSDLLQLLAASGAAVAKSKDTKLTSLSYRKGYLDMDLETKNLQDLDKIASQVNAGGVAKASVQTAKSENDRVRGRIRIEPKS